MCGSVLQTLTRFQTKICHTLFCFFFIRTSNFGAEAERSYIFWRFEAENVLKIFLNYMVYTTCISVNHCGRDQETDQSDYDKPTRVSPLLMLYKTFP